MEMQKRIFLRFICRIIKLFIGMLEDGTQADVLQGRLNGYKGAIFENLAADLFIKMGREIYYYHKSFLV